MHVFFSFGVGDGDGRNVIRISYPSKEKHAFISYPINFLDGLQLNNCICFFKTYYTKIQASNKWYSNHKFYVCKSYTFNSTFLSCSLNVWLIKYEMLHMATLRITVTIQRQIMNVQRKKSTKQLYILIKFWCWQKFLNDRFNPKKK